ncbi:MAG: 30S ribosomal protein S9 [Candidatus Pacearchaeota archaeon]
MRKTKEKKEIKEEKEAKPIAITVSGKRKTAIAKATIKAGTGIVRVNKKPIEIFPYFQKLTLLEPIRIAEDTLKQKLAFDINVNVKGGGSEAQVEASRLAIAKSLVAFTKSQELKSAYLAYDRSLLVADTRRKEMYKPNDSRARASRQKSYR